MTILLMAALSGAGIASPYDSDTGQDADAVVDEWPICDSGEEDPDCDSGDTGESAEDAKPCGCAASGRSGGAWVMLIGALGLVRRRR